MCYLNEIEYLYSTQNITQVLRKNDSILAFIEMDSTKTFSAVVFL